MAEYDKWVRKVVKLLLDMGFKDVSSKRGRHRKFRYDGDGVDKPCTIVIQSKMREYARFDALLEIKNNLKNAGADDELITKFDTLALGMMIPESDEEIDELETALSSALRLDDGLAIATAGIELGKRIQAKKLKDYVSSSIQNILDEKKNSEIARILNDKIETTLSHLFRSALKAHIERHHCFEFYTRSYGGSVSRFDDDIAQHFGFICMTHESNGSTELELGGMFAGELKEAFNEAKVHASFRAIFSDDSGEGDQCYYSTDGFYDVWLSIGKMTMETHKKLANDIEQIGLKALLGWKFED